MKKQTKPKPSAKPSKASAAKTAAKSAAKTAKKPLAKAAKAPEKTKKPAGKAPSKAAKTTSKDDANLIKSQAKKPEPTKVSAKTAKNAKKKKDEDMEDALVPDDDMGSEELPDLSEFEEGMEEESDEQDEVLLATSGPIEVKEADDEVVLTDAEGRRLCRVKDCDQAASVEGYCRYHYLLLWKKIQVRRKILVDGKLERYVEELTSRYPDKFLEMIKKDLRTEKDFLAAIAELEIDESAIENDFEEDSGFIDEVRGVSSESSISDEEEF